MPAFIAGAIWPFYDCKVDLFCIFLRIFAGKTDER